MYVCLYVRVAVSVVIQRVGVNPVTVAVDGSLYRFHPHFKQLMSAKISQLLPTNLQVTSAILRHHREHAMYIDRGALHNIALYKFFILFYSIL